MDSEDNSVVTEHEAIDEDDGFCSISDSDRQYIETVLQTETSLRSEADTNSVLADMWWFESERKDSIKWILRKRVEFEYSEHTAYLSALYLDRFLTRFQIHDAKQRVVLRILSIACLSLAAKTEEIEAMPLGEYVGEEKYLFHLNSIKKVELIFLETLEWRMRIATPFTFVTYFAAKFSVECRDPQDLIRKANHLVLSMMEDTDVAKHRPSVVAAAAVLAAHDKHLSREALGSKMDGIPFWGGVEKESTVSCYSRMQGILELGTPESVVSHNVATAVDDSASTSRGTKRRLQFD
ncbi:cyclin-D5-1-like [Salvia divinorum]|uniref:Cyclin-D5-1-like n=1 Tax=Salvia divinorum TaxID=28513 RepID=A0ABD1IHE5_SALDI